MKHPKLSELTRLRLAKVWFSIVHPLCWPAFVRGIVPTIEHGKVLRSLQCDLVLDVGANRGQFTLMARLLYPSMPIHAYEPLPLEATSFRKLHSGRPGIVLHELALGEKAGVAELHISGRADSSSLLPIGELQSRLFPQTEEVGTRSVTVAPLDSLPAHWRGASRALLKLDVQGFELQVLRGATETLRHCAYVYVECSEVLLYAGQALRAEVVDFLAQRGFREVGRFNPQMGDGRLIQADYLFQRG